MLHAECLGEEKSFDVVCHEDINCDDELMKRVLVEMTEPSMAQHGIFLCHHGMIALKYVKTMRFGIFYGIVRTFELLRW